MRDAEKRLLTDETVCKMIKSNVEDCILKCVFITIGGGLVFALLALILSLLSVVADKLELPSFLLWVAPAVLLFFMIRYYIKNIKMAIMLKRIIKNTDFTIYEDTVYRIGEKEFNPKNGSGTATGQYETAFYFNRFGRFVPQCGEGVFTLPNDKFYIVSYNCATEKPIFIFPAKLYDYNNKKPI